MSETVIERSKRVGKNTMLLYIRMFVTLIIGLYTSRVVLGTLGVDDYGIYNVVGSVVTFFVFFQHALTNATYRFFTVELAKGSDNISKVYTMSVKAHLILGVCVFIIAEVVGLWFIYYKMNMPQGRLIYAIWAFQFSLLTFVVNLIKVPLNSSVVAHERMDFYAYISIVEAILKLLVVYLLIVSPIDKLVSYSLLNCLVSIVILLVFYLYCSIKFTEYKYIPKYWDSAFFSKLIKYSGLSILNNIADSCTVQGFNVFFNIFYGVAVNAALGVANQVMSQINGFVGNFATAYGPQIIKSYSSGEKTYFMSLLMKTSKVSFFLFYIVALPIFLNIDFILDIWLINPPEETANFLRIIIFYFLIDIQQIPFSTAVHATGNLKVHQLGQFVIKMTNVPATFILLYLGCPVYYPLVYYSITSLFGASFRMWWMTRLIDLDITSYLKEVILPEAKVLLFSTPVPILLFYLTSGWLQLLASCSFCIICTILAILLLGLTKGEKQLLQGFIKRKLNK